jgi:peptidoglycan/LPS O-acetylase OafA/YrhL
MAGQPNRQFSLLDLVFWTLWIAVLAAIVRLRRSDDGTTDRAYIATMALATCIALGALWGYSRKLSLSSAVLLRIAIVMLAFFIGSLLSVQISLAAMSHYELAALALCGVIVLVVGFKIASR